MGTTTKEVEAAIHKTKHLLSTISKERIRDEFLKGIKSAKSTIHFLQLIDKYNLFDWVFPGLEINKEFIEDNDGIILVSELLKNNDPSELKKKLNKLTYSSDEIDKIYYLIHLLKLSPQNAPRLKKGQKYSKLEEEQIKKFADLNNIDPKLIKAFLKFKLTVGGDEIMAQGFKNEEIGKEILRREILNFKKIV